MENFYIELDFDQNLPSRDKTNMRYVPQLERFCLVQKFLHTIIDFLRRSMTK